MKAQNYDWTSDFILWLRITAKLYQAGEKPAMKVCSIIGLLLALCWWVSGYCAFISREWVLFFCSKDPTLNWSFNVSQILQYHLKKFRPKNHQLITWTLYVVILSFCCYLLATTPRANNSSSWYTALLYFCMPKIDEISYVFDKK